MKHSLLKEIVVWLLIGIGVIIFSIFAYIIGSSKGNFMSSIAIYKTVLPEATGIYAGTKVTIHGKNTGNVISTALLPSGEIRVRFSIREKHTFSLTESSFIELKNSGALGDRFINIVTKDLSATSLKRGALIPYKKSFDILSFLTGGGKGSKNLATQIDGFLNRLNQKGLGFLSRKNQEDLTQILNSTKNILKKIESGQGTLGAVINDRALYNRLLVLLGQRPTKNYLQDLSQQSQKAKRSRKAKK